MDVYWLDTEKTLLVRELPKVWTWQEYKESLQKMRQMLQEVQHDVVLIIYCPETQWLPKNSTVHFERADSSLPSNVIVKIIVSERKRLEEIASNSSHSWLLNFGQAQQGESLS
jgi:hypothetical protein